MDIYAQGIRDFVFKEDPGSQDWCRKKLWVLWALDWLLQGGMLVLLGWGVAAWLMG